MNPPRIEPLGDCAALIHCGEAIAADVNAQALAIAHALIDADLPGITDIVPAYASVCVRYEPGAWIGADAQSPFDRLAVRLGALVENAQPVAPIDAGLIEIPVSYGGEFGPDLDDVAAHAGLMREAVIDLHGSAEYRVAMLGFTPGFAYLLGLPDALHMPRRATPRTRVPAGSVAIGGAQTGVYPRETPGGWHLIGRTPLNLFDPARDPPALLKPGMRVKFVAR
ncbi:MAG: 5-oxoprolinase subunit PxpB [Proteobacteria bacterium]|nr:5-oxoprolinase subunit PxpB [Pseudomonadota bacterium]